MKPSSYEHFPEIAEAETNKKGLCIDSQLKFSPKNNFINVYIRYQRTILIWNDRLTFFYIVTLHL